MMMNNSHNNRISDSMKQIIIVHHIHPNPKIKTQSYCGIDQSQRTEFIFVQDT